MWDSIYDSLQTINLHELTNTHVEKQTVYECIDVGPSAKDALIKHVPQSTYGELCLLAGLNIILDTEVNIPYGCCIALVLHKTTQT